MSSCVAAVTAITNRFANDVGSAASQPKCKQTRDEINNYKLTDKRYLFANNFKSGGLFFSTPKAVCKNIDGVVAASARIVSKCKQTVAGSNSSGKVYKYHSR